MNINELYEKAMTQEYLYSICQHECDGMSNCKMFAEGNDIGCLKSYYYYLGLIEKNERLKFEKF